MQNYVLRNDQLFTERISKFVSNLPKDIVDLWKNNLIILAGGAIRNCFENKEPRDLDFFIFDNNIFNQCGRILLSEGYAEKIHDINFCKYKKSTLEIDICWMPNSTNVFDILETFDFTISKVAYYNNAIIIHNRFDNDLINKELVYCGSHNPKASWVRQVVFKEMGYTIDEKNLRLIAADINQLL